MDNHGNKDQWPVGYPSKEMITKDIDKMYLCMYENQINCCLLLCDRRRSRL